jgi:hypothetical protein
MDAALCVGMHSGLLSRFVSSLFVWDRMPQLELAPALLDHE